MPLGVSAPESLRLVPNGIVSKYDDLYVRNIIDKFESVLDDSVDSIHSDGA